MVFDWWQVMATFGETWWNWWQIGMRSYVEYQIHADENVKLEVAMEEPIAWKVEQEKNG